MLNPPGPGMTQNLSALSAIVEGDRAAVFGENPITLASGKSTLLHFVDQFERKGGRWRVVASYVTDLLFLFETGRCGVRSARFF